MMADGKGCAAMLLIFIVVVGLLYLAGLGAVGLIGGN